MLSRTQARLGRAVKQEQEQNSRNLVQAFLLVSVCTTTLSAFLNAHLLNIVDEEMGTILENHSKRFDSFVGAVFIVTIDAAQKMELANHVVILQ